MHPRPYPFLKAAIAAPSLWVMAVVACASYAHYTRDGFFALGAIMGLLIGSLVAFPIAAILSVISLVRREAKRVLAIAVVLVSTGVVAFVLCFFGRELRGDFGLFR